MASMSETALVALAPSRDVFSWHEYPPFARAAEEAIYYREHGAAPKEQTAVGKPAALRPKKEVLSVAEVVWDEELGAECAELLSSSPPVCITMPCQVTLPLLCVHLKDVGRFCGIEVQAVDAAGTVRVVLVSNKQAAIRITEAACSMPLDLVPGWNHIRLDLVALLKAAFGVGYQGCVGVSVYASCRLGRVYFEQTPLEDAELPPWLQTMRAHHEAAAEAQAASVMARGTGLERSMAAL